MKEIITKIIHEAKNKLSPEEFNEWLEQNYKISSPMTPNGVFYNRKEMEEYEENTNKKI